MVQFLGNFSSRIVMYGKGECGGVGAWGTVVKLTCADADYHVA